MTISQSRHKRQKGPSSLHLKRRKPKLPRYHSHWQNLPASGIGAAAPRESRPFGNGGETRSRLNRRPAFSGNTRGPVTSSPSAPPRSSRRLSEALRGDSLPVIVSVRFAFLTKYRTGADLSSPNFGERVVFPGGPPLSGGGAAPRARHGGDAPRGRDGGPAAGRGGGVAPRARDRRFRAAGAGRGVPGHGPGKGRRTPHFLFSVAPKRENPPEGPLAASRLTLTGRARSKREKALCLAGAFRFD